MTKKVGKKEWTVMVYMAGDNNLDPEGVQDLKEMKQVGSTDAINVIAQFDRAAGHVARRYYLRKGDSVAADVVESVGAVNTGDPKFLDDFIAWGIAKYPAKHYVLVLWNHGQGWDDTDIYADERFRAERRLATGRVRHALFRTPVRRVLEQARTDRQARAILLDDDAKDFLDNHEMKRVLARMASKLGHKLDVLGMDACLMSMAEVAFQVHGSVAFTVGSEQTEPGEGWPYATILGDLAKKPGMVPGELCKRIVDRYLASYRASDIVNYSACDLSQAPALAAAVRKLAAALMAGLRDDTAAQKIQSVRAKVQAYEVPDNVDLLDLCSLLAAARVSAPVVTACREVVESIRSGYVMKQGFKGNSMANSHGVAIYFPRDAVSPLYPGLDFSRKTRWHKFLEAYLTTTRKR